MDSENLQPGVGEFRPGEIIEKEKELKYIPLKPPDEVKIEVEIREIIRIMPDKLGSLKLSFEDWRSQWED